MERVAEEAGWNQKRYDIRTYTAQNERNRRNGVAGEISDEYIYIGDKCFLNNGKVHGVTLPAGCRVVGKQAFEGCQFQKAVEFPESLVEIKRRGFAGNRRLRKVAEFEKNSKCKVISEGIFDSCTKLERVCLPEAVKSIEKRAFYRCKELKEINLPNSVTEIGEEAFYFCGIEELELPTNLKIIGDSAFFRCKNLRTVYIPTSVRTIGRWAFHGCSRLERIEIFHDPDEIGPLTKAVRLYVRRAAGSMHMHRNMAFRQSM